MAVQNIVDRQLTPKFISQDDRFYPSKLDIVLLATIVASLCKYPIVQKLHYSLSTVAILNEKLSP